MMGDLNARFGISVQQLPREINLSHFSYPFVPDPLPNPNDNALVLLGMCIDERLLIINNLKTQFSHFKSALTYRQGLTWTSEIDSCLVSDSMVDLIENFEILQDLSLPSNHAPLCLTINSPGINLQLLAERALQLGDHAALHYKIDNKLMKPPLAINQIDKEAFVGELAQHRESILDDNINDSVKRVSDCLYDCARSSMVRAPLQDVDIAIDRWERLMQENDSTGVWRAINWKG